MRQRRNQRERKTIRRQILIPFIVIITLVPLLIIGSFNIVFNIYVDKTTRSELISTRNNAYSLMNATFSTDEIDEIHGAHNSIGDTAKLLVSALAASRLSGNTEFLLLYQGKIAYPKNPKTSFITASVIKNLDIMSIPADNKIYVRQADNTSFYLTATMLDSYQGMPDVTMLFVATTAGFEEMISILNIALLIAIVIITAVAILVFLSLSKRISEPITYASKLATQIGNGDFVEVPTDYSYEEIYQLSTSLNEMSLQLKEAESVQKKFLQNASHELRTPLMSIQGYAEGIEKHVVTDTMAAAGIIRQESIRMKKLVDELLTLSRIENQSHQIKLSSYNISNLILDYIQSIKGLAMKKNINIETDLNSEVIANVDETLFSQIILNVLSNCINYAKSKVLITTKYQDLHAVILINDDGRGFSEEDIEHVFERFYKGSGGNFGLGLAIASSAAKYMQANISAANAKNGGALFEIIF